MTHSAEDLRQRLDQLALYGLLEHWDEIGSKPWLAQVIELEERERQRRSLERRTRNARLGRFKALADFDWKWPKRIEREQIEDILRLTFIREAANVVLVGPNGVGKTMIAKNLAHQAVVEGHTVLFTTASGLLNDLAAQDSSSSLQRRLRRYYRPHLLIIDELGYLSYDNRHADLLFEVVSKRYGEKSIVITTNKPFGEWNEVFPNATCVVTLVDRLVHNAEIIQIDGPSFRLKEAKEKSAARAKQRAARKKTRTRNTRSKRS